MKKMFGLFLLLAMVNWACTPSAKENQLTPQQKAEELKAQVMAQHDSTMAHMGALYRERKNLEQLRDSLNTKDAAAIQPLEKAIADLAAAEESMMQWMRTYRAPDLSKPDSALRYLAKEKEKIAIVQKDINQSLQKAAAILAQLTSK